MDAGLAAHGHGWPIAAGPRSRTGARVCRAQARHRTKGARAFGYLALFQVTRRKGETNSRRDRRNGYVPQQESHRRSGSHREQAHSYSLIRVHQGNTHRLSDRHRWQASSHHLIRVHPKRKWSTVRPSSLASQLPQENACASKVKSARRPPRFGF
jgi:hypothetical protein